MGINFPMQGFLLSFVQKGRQTEMKHQAVNLPSDLKKAIEALEKLCKEHNLGCPVAYLSKYNSLGEAIGAAYLGMR